jgi:uncharacterized protein YodC (DUF2158 family)
MTENKKTKSMCVGDVVALKSGSPRMVIFEIKGSAASVLWSDFDTKAIHKETFPLCTLTRT